MVSGTDSREFNSLSQTNSMGTELISSIDNKELKCCFCIPYAIGVKLIGIFELYQIYPEY